MDRLVNQYPQRAGNSTSTGVVISERLSSEIQPRSLGTGSSLYIGSEPDFRQDFGFVLALTPRLGSKPVTNMRTRLKDRVEASTRTCEAKREILCLSLESQARPGFGGIIAIYQGGGGFPGFCQR